MKPLLTILTIFILCLFISHQTERCEHILIKGDAVGITQYYVTMCLTEQVQVNNHGEHFESKRSEEYFK
jgi:uncharacterized membrane protein YeiH